MPVVLRHSSLSPPPALRNRIQEGVCNTFLIVVPTKRRIRHLARDLVGRMPRRVAPPLHLHTLETLATDLFSRIRPGIRIVTGVTQTLLFRQAVLSCGPSLRYFTLRRGAFPLQRGTFETVVAVLTRIKESGVSPEVLEAELEIAEPDELHKLADVLAVYRAYENGLEQGGLTDTGGVFRALALGCTEADLAAAFRAVFPEVDLVAIAGFDEFSEPELALLRKLRGMPGLSLDLTFDYDPGNPALFGNLEENYRRFREMGLREPAAGEKRDWLDVILGRETAAQPAASGLAVVTRKLFLPGHSSARVNLSESITLVRARDRREEVELVCRTIKRMVLENPGTDLSRVCVAMHVPALYTPLFRRTFSRYGIPANITDRFELSRSPLVIAVLGLLKVVAHGFRREDILRIADSPYFSIGPDPAAGAHALAEVSGRLKIPGGYRTWLGRIDAALEAAESQRKSPETGFPGSIAANPAMLHAVRGHITRLQALLAPFGASLTATAFQKELDALLGRLAVLRTLTGVPPNAPGDGRERDVRAFTRFTRVLADMTAALSAMEDPATGRPLAYYLESLSVAVAGERYNVREQFGQGVLVTAIEETRGLPMDVMFLVGLVDGEFPSVYKPEVFYSLSRQKLRARRHAWEQRYLFYQAITNWSDRLYLSYPEQEGELELVRSTFVDALQETAEMSTPRTGDLMAGGELLSRSDLLRHCALSPDRAGSGELRAATGTGEAVTAVRRAVAVEQSRLETHALPSYEGRIGAALPGETGAPLHALRNRVFSVSQLESYGACPFQFFGERVLRLRPPEDLREDLSPMERGSLLHEVLFEFMKRRTAQGLPDLWRCTDAEGAQAEAELLHIARERLERMDLPDPFWEADRDALLGTGGKPGLLREYLRHERGRHTPLEARFFEVAFGPRMSAAGPVDETLSSDEPVMVGSVRLRGRVDRVEIGQGVFSIIDYKTGQAHSGLEDIRRGLSLQLPLYLRAVQQLLKSRLGVDAAPASGLHYYLTDEVTLSPVLASAEQRGIGFEDHSRSRQLVPTDEDLSTLIDDTAARAEQYVTAMAEGTFPLTSPDKIARVCRSCGLNTLCRIQAAHHLEPGKEDAQ